MSDFSVIIPARLKSSRLPKKLLQEVAGKPLLYHTYQNALKSNASEVIIATDSVEIREVMQDYGARCVLTSDAHISGTSRIQEVVETLEMPADHHIINVQGDEPLMPASNINQLAKLLVNTPHLVATLCEKFNHKDDFLSAHNVKVVRNAHNEALYFSRAPIPHFRDDEIDLSLCYKHIGIYGYKVAFFNQVFAENSYEHAEKLEQLSILQSGYNIAITVANEHAGVGVDTAEDLEKVRKLFMK